MSSKVKDHRGRPKDNIEKIDKYIQVFDNDDGTKSIWTWDKTITNKGPLSVEIEYPNSKIITKLEKEQIKIKNKYIAIEGQRKPRILKIDKLRLEEIEKLIEQEYLNQ